MGAYATRVLTARRVKALDGRWLRASGDGGEAVEAAFADIAADGGWAPAVAIGPEVELPRPVVVALADGLVRVRPQERPAGRLSAAVEPLAPDAEVRRVTLDGSLL